MLSLSLCCSLWLLTVGTSAAVPLTADVTVADTIADMIERTCVSGACRPSLASYGQLTRPRVW
jgi:hypothetical protein